MRTFPDADERVLRRSSMVRGRVSRPAARRIQMHPYISQALVATRIAEMRREAGVALLARDVKRARRQAACTDRAAVSRAESAPGPSASAWRMVALRDSHRPTC
jgi:hypothetical protein